MKMLHGTTFKNFLSIIRDGSIIPQKKYGAGMDIENCETFNGFVFLTNKLTTALEYGLVTADRKEPIVIIEVDVLKQHLLPDDNDLPGCKKYTESLEKINQVKVKGKINNTQITEITFFGPCFQINCGINEWENVYIENREKFYKSF